MEPFLIHGLDLIYIFKKTLFRGVFSGEIWCFDFFILPLMLSVGLKWTNRELILVLCDYLEGLEWGGRLQEGYMFNYGWFAFLYGRNRGFPGCCSAKEPACQCRKCKEMLIPFLGPEDPLEEGMAVHSSILAWRIQWTEEWGGLQSMGSQRVEHDWSNLACTHGRNQPKIVKQLSNRKLF